ncbi:ferritin-like domain-containing protein [Allostreptomyces psammosilenae]|uniref:DUF4439 domain-containing protein n=1 Tax=Allostreptomyces psammosilenae TaxID=1892865 RepID=A0A853ADC0_9ACTN|nr:ferritin-like domain-containing protein [Allostreptomyces psammosilenae]NYI08438.1 hypothetical protein [Allostreptomyces psammosilenae]
MIGRSATPSPAPTRQPDNALPALQAALAGEHAAVYGYGVAGALLSGADEEEARVALAAHQERREALSHSIRQLGGQPEAAAPAYQLPFEVADADSARRLATHLEEGVAAAEADVVFTTVADLRLAAAEALREATVRAVRWRGGTVAFPGLPEREPGAGPSGSSAPSASATRPGGA